MNNLAEKVNKNKIKIKNSNKNIKFKNNINFNTLKISELKNLLKKKKLSVSGKKSELIQRLKANSH